MGRFSMDSICINDRVCGTGQANGRDYGQSLHECAHVSATLSAAPDGHAGDAGQTRARANAWSARGDANDHASR